MEHPYKKHERTLLWKKIKKSIDELIENQDIELTTREEYVIGFLCDQLTRGVVKPKEERKPKEILLGGKQVPKLFSKKRTVIPSKDISHSNKKINILSTEKKISKSKKR